MQISLACDHCSEGRTWALSGFRTAWRPIRARLEEEGRVQPGLTLYGLRHTVAVIMRETGHDERTIAGALGQRTTEMARPYAKGADLAPKMRAVVPSLNAEFARRVVTAERKSVNPAGMTLQKKTANGI